jgi:hypothetical protein
VPDEAGTKNLSMFFVVGPLRTGTSLLARCIDDHPSAICLCESEINRALFRDYAVQLYCQRMLAHGLTLEESIAYLDRKKQDDIETWEQWFSEVRPRLAELYGKPCLLLGDKSPDFFRSSQLVEHLASKYPLVYTTRDPRAIFRSIDSQPDASPEDKKERWDSLIQNYNIWKPYLGCSNVLITRYEDLITSSVKTMQSVYAHLGLPDSLRFLEWFQRPFPQRFLWSTAVDLDTGMRKSFDSGRVESWKTTLSDAQISQVRSDVAVAEFMDRFGYGH